MYLRTYIMDSQVDSIQANDSNSSTATLSLSLTQRIHTPTPHSALARVGRRSSVACCGVVVLIHLSLSAVL